MFTNDKYPKLFRMVPSETGFNPTKIELLRRYNWTWVGTIFQKELRYSLVRVGNSVDSWLLPCLPLFQNWSRRFRTALAS